MLSGKGATHVRELNLELPASKSSCSAICVGGGGKCIVWVGFKGKLWDGGVERREGLAEEVKAAEEAR